MSDQAPAGGQPPAADPGGQAGQGSEADRIKKLEDGQERIETTLDTLLQRVGPGNAPQSGRQPAGEPAEMGPGRVQQEMRAAIRAVNAEQAAAAAQQQPKQPPAEQTPREVTVRGKERLQRILFGGDPK